MTVDPNPLRLPCGNREISTREFAVNCLGAVPILGSVVGFKRWCYGGAKTVLAGSKSLKYRIDARRHADRPFTAEKKAEIRSLYLSGQYHRTRGIGEIIPGGGLVIALAYDIGGDIYHAKVIKDKTSKGSPSESSGGLAADATPAAPGIPVPPQMSTPSPHGNAPSTTDINSISIEGVSANGSSESVGNRQTNGGTHLTFKDCNVTVVVNN